MPKSIQDDGLDPAARVFSGGDGRVRPENNHLGRRDGHDAGDLTIDKLVPREDV